MKPHTVTPTERIGLIAGSGSFPLIFAERARSRGLSVVAVAHEGETDPTLSEHVERVRWLPLGQLDAMIAFFKSSGITRVVMAGGIRKTRLFDLRPDARCLAVLARLPEKKDDLLLRAFADELAAAGIEITAATPYLSDLLAEKNEMTRPLTPVEWEDVRWGWRLAKAVGALDIGQCVVVKKGVILAIEAIEGTDAAIRRGGALAQGQAVVIKVCKPQQDTRFDLPTVGAGTLRAMREVHAAVLAVEAGATLLLDKATLLSEALAANIAVVGCKAEAEGG